MVNALSFQVELSVPHVPNVQGQGLEDSLRQDWIDPGQTFQGHPQMINFRLALRKPFINDVTQLEEPGSKRSLKNSMKIDVKKAF